MHMSKVAVIYFSATGNTQAMANAVADGAKAAGAEVDLLDVSSADAASTANYDGIALGCPAMGAEQLEETTFEPFFQSALPFLAGKKVALFGSYGWGDGTWMRLWEETCAQNGITLAHDSVMANNAPDASALAECEALGKSVA